MILEPTTIRLLLGDQLNLRHSWFRSVRPDVVYTLMEIRPEATYVRHHIQKLVAFFAAMRAFAAALEQQGHRIVYIPLDAPENLNDFASNCRMLMQRFGSNTFAYQLPDEWRLDQQLNAFAHELKAEGTTVEVADTEHFLSQRDTLANLFSGKKTYLMETFYRKMRTEHNILMEPDGHTPLTGRWNYDAENRKKLPASVSLPPAYQPKSTQNVSKLVEIIHQCGIPTLGHIDPAYFHWPVTREESLAALRNFIDHRFSHYGAYQDAMSTRDWLLFHSGISFALNAKMLHPSEVASAAVDAWQERPSEVPFAAVEGFVRQIVGWREYMRGVYWAHMPDYAGLNFFDHQAPLPEWFWTGRTRMRCLAHAVGQSIEHAYAHHIQRLMITGNFSLLLGVHPDAVDDWYLGIYIDAVQWVEITNTRGMSQYADGGIVGTKPYAASANYIHKMSDYCAQCPYDKSRKYGERACPFNSLYWDFYHRHRDKLGRNPRIGMVYPMWDKMGDAEQTQILEHAAWVKAHIETF